MIKETSLRLEAYKYVKDALVSGRLKAGSRLSTQLLAADIGISRTPVAEALLILEHEGFLERFPRSASVIRQPDYLEVAELYELRLALESYAVEQAAKRISDEQVKILKSFLERLKKCLLWLKDGNHKILDSEMLRQYLASDAAFHLFLVQIGGNSKITKVLDDTHVFTKIFCFPRERENYQNYENVLKVYKFHSSIYRAIKKRDSVLARQLIEKHILVSKDSSLEFLKSSRQNIARLSDIYSENDESQKVNYV